MENVLVTNHFHAEKVQSKHLVPLSTRLGSELQDSQGRAADSVMGQKSMQWAFQIREIIERERVIYNPSTKTEHCSCPCTDSDTVSTESINHVMSIFRTSVSTFIISPSMIPCT